MDLIVLVLVFNGMVLLFEKKEWISGASSTSHVSRCDRLVAWITIHSPWSALR